LPTSILIINANIVTRFVLLLTGLRFFHLATLNLKPCTLHPATLHPATLHAATLHLAPCTLHLAPCILAVCLPACLLACCSGRLGPGSPDFWLLFFFSPSNSGTFFLHWGFHRLCHFTKWVMDVGS
jgi:hypothetical protein